MGLSVADVAKVLTGQKLSESIDYTPYDFNKISVKLGTPPMPVVGLDYVSARHLHPQRKRFQCLSGRGIFVSNINTAGIIEFGILGGSLSQGVIDVMQLTGIPYPIQIDDTTTGGTSSVLATACQLVETPEWKREAMPGLTIYTFEAARLIVNHGLRIPFVVL